jgi:hypothetical protein
MDFLASRSPTALPQNIPDAAAFTVVDVFDDDVTEGDIPDDHGSDHGSLASTVMDHSTVDAQDFMDDDDHHGDDNGNETVFMGDLPHGEN